MTKEVITPFLGANDDQAVLKSWLINLGSKVESGIVLCELETTKSIIEVESDSTGYFFSNLKEGDHVKVDQAIGYISESHEFNLEEYINIIISNSQSKNRVTKKAEILIEKNSLNYEDVQKSANGEKVTEEIVRNFMRRGKANSLRLGIGLGRKIGIIGGVGGGGALIVADAIARIADMQAVAVYERDEKFHGNSILGVPVVGAISRLLDDLAFGAIDGVVIAFNRDVGERHALFVELNSQGVPFVNVIDPTADIRNNVKIGCGNIILGHVYIGACSDIQDNNFISANVALEHGNILGSSCAFGPGVFTSGNVTIGDRVRFGTGIYVEPNLSIEDDSIIGSGQTIVTSVAKGKLLFTQTKSRA